MMDEFVRNLEWKIEKKVRTTRCNEVTLRETVDLRAVKYLNSMPKAWWKEILKTDKERKFEVEYKKVKTFLSGQLDGTGITRHYKFADGKTFGRQFDHSGLQGMQKAIRGALCEGSVSDLDMVNCHPMILAWICRKYDIACPSLEHYIRNRDKILTEICDNSKYDKCDAKTLFLKSTNSSWRHKPFGNDFFDSYDSEMKKIQKKLNCIPDYSFIKPKVKKGDNEDGSFINLCLCYHENLILMEAMKHLQSKNVEICTLAFDGLMHYGLEDEALLNSLNTCIQCFLKDSDFKFIYKPHLKCISVPADFDETQVPDKTYKMMCREFNLTHAKVGDKYICEDMNGEKLVQTEMNIKQRYKHLRVYDRDEQFIDAWLKNITNTNMRVYTMFGLHPEEKACPKNTYNLWEPFAYSLKTGDYTPDKEALSKIRHLIMCLANHEEKSETFLLDWMAQMIQYPKTKSLVPVIQSDQGAGKNTLVDILRELLGKNKVWDCVDPLRDIFGNFNGKMKNAFLVNLNESSSKDFKGVMGKVKAFVTDSEFTLRAMQQDAIELPSFHRFILTTNDDFPIPTGKGDRRFGIIAASNDLIDNKAFFTDMYDNVITSETAMRTFWDFLMARPVKEKMTKEDLPDTEYHQELKRLDEHPIIQWVQNIARISPKQTIRMSSDTIWDSYRDFCRDSNINFDRVNRRGFETKMGITLKSIPGASTKIQSTNGRVRVFDLELIRGHYNIDKPDELKMLEDPDPE